jgi:hypothetical protein
MKRRQLLMLAGGTAATAVVVGATAPADFCQHPAAELVCLELLSIGCLHSRCQF